MKSLMKTSTTCDDNPYFFNGSTKPYTRWWWLQGPFLETDIARQLDWIKANGFGGVEIAWLAPAWIEDHKQPPKWLSTEWTEIVTLTSRLASDRNLGCDFTFGSCWPFGGSWVTEENGSQSFAGASGEPLRGSWEEYSHKACKVVNHLSKSALIEYSKPLLAALHPALRQNNTALFCDSLEIQTNKLWDQQLWDKFENRFGYRLEPHIDLLNSMTDVRYDYRKLIAETMSTEFYAAFTDIAHSANAHSRIQCHGSPTDLLTAYACADIPESETLLFEPHFSRIPASAGVLADKAVISAETFTCIYGFSHYRDPNLCELWKQEDINDLKLLADAIFANGVNQIVWHGMPFNAADDQTEFYAAVHVGQDSAIADSLPQFNRYMDDICQIMQAGKTMTQLAVYLPNEDNWMAGGIPKQERTPGAKHHWEMRHVIVPTETEGYHPIWISPNFLKNATVENNTMRVDNSTFQALYIDCNWLDDEALTQICRLAKNGLPIVMKKTPRQPGFKLKQTYQDKLKDLFALKNVFNSIDELKITPFISGEKLPFYWARQTDDGVYVFLAHPATRDIHFPMKHHQSRVATAQKMTLQFAWMGHNQTLGIQFKQQASVILRLQSNGKISDCSVGLQVL